MDDEHQRLVDAVNRLVDVIDLDFVGDLPAAVNVVARELGRAGGVERDVRERLLVALRGISR